MDDHLEGDRDIHENLYGEKINKNEKTRDE